jgi:ArsR family transcriptional regulator, lead/cadmium/zinc/bismuth-responsive transcriptional repressor
MEHMSCCSDKCVSSEAGSLDACERPCIHHDRVDRVREVLLADAAADGLAEIFSLLGDRTRVRILHALFLGELCVCDISAALNISASAISHQLRLLRTAKLVRARKEGKNVFYALDDGHVYSLIAQGLEHVLE